MIAILLTLACAKHPVIDMQQPPAVAPTAKFTPVAPTETQLSNGAKLWHVHRPGLPLLSVDLVIPGGSAKDPSDAPGTVYLADAMTLEGAGTRDATAFSAEEDRLAVDISVNTLDSATIISLDAHLTHLEGGLDLFTDAVRRPNFGQSDLDRVKETTLADYKERLDSPKSISSWVMDELYYGETHPLAPSVTATQKAIAQATIPALKSSWESRFAPGHATFVVVGDLTLEEATQALETRFADWSGEGVTSTIPAPNRPSTGAQMVFVNHPGTSQTSLRVMMPAPAADTETDAGARLGSIVLGGTFTSRLNQLLREEKGYTYGAGARVTAWATHGTLTASTAVQGEVSAPALKDLLGALETYQSGVNEAELTKARSATQTRVIEAMGSRSSIASVYAMLAAARRPLTALQDGLTKSEAATIEDVQAGILQSQLNQGVILVVGDLEKIQSDIEAAVPGEWTVHARPE